MASENLVRIDEGGYGDGGYVYSVDSFGWGYWFMDMKCIDCGTDNLPERTNNQGRLKNCGHWFAFEPVEVTSLQLIVLVKR